MSSPQDIAQHRLALSKGLAPQVITIEQQQIERAGEVIEAAPMRSIKVRSILSSAHDLSVDDCGVFDPGGLFNGAPLILAASSTMSWGIHRIEPHPPVSDVDAVAIMLQLIHPAGDRAAGAETVGRMNEGGSGAAT